MEAEEQRRKLMAQIKASTERDRRTSERAREEAERIRRDMEDEATWQKVLCLVLLQSLLTCPALAT
jgi:hypothetical protein